MLVGIFAMVCGQGFHAGQGVVEEYILKSSGSNGQEPFYMMGWEGCWGLLIASILMVFA
jgi:hypothetical protein